LRRAVSANPALQLLTIKLTYGYHHSAAWHERSLTQIAT
jgi:hypothetical protein